MLVRRRFWRHGSSVGGEVDGNHGPEVRATMLMERCYRIWSIILASGELLCADRSRAVIYYPAEHSWRARLSFSIEHCGRSDQCKPTQALCWNGSCKIQPSLVYAACRLQGLRLTRSMVTKSDRSCVALLLIAGQFCSIARRLNSLSIAMILWELTSVARAALRIMFALLRSSC